MTRSSDFVPNYLDHLRQDKSSTAAFSLEKMHREVKERGSYEGTQTEKFLKDLTQKAQWDPFFYYLIQLRYMDYGEQIFNLGPNLQELFSRTELHNVYPKDIRLPYDSFFISLGGQTFQSADGYEIIGLYVSQNLIGVSDDDKTVTPQELETVKNARIDKSLNLMICMKNFHNLDDADHSIVTFQYEMKHDLEYHLKKIEKTPASLNDIPAGEMTTIILYGPGVLEKILRIAINFLLYLNSDKAEIEVTDTMRHRRRKLKNKIDSSTGAKKKRLQKQLAQLPAKTITRVFPSIEKVDITSGHGGSPRAHWVRGHYRRQPFGPRSDPQYRRIWIMPFMRGDTENPVERDHYQIPVPNAPSSSHA